MEQSDKAHVIYKVCAPEHLELLLRLMDGKWCSPFSRRSWRQGRSRGGRFINGQFVTDQNTITRPVQVLSFLLRKTERVDLRDEIARLKGVGEKMAASEAGLKNQLDAARDLLSDSRAEVVEFRGKANQEADRRRKLEDDLAKVKARIGEREFERALGEK